MVVQLTCDYCGDIFNKYPSQVSENNYCSEECYHNTKEGKKSYICDNCDEEFVEYTSSRNQGDNKYVYCSRECYTEHLSIRRSGEGNPAWEGGKVNIECDWCGDCVEKWDPQIRDNNFCSNTCRLSWFSDEYGGDNIRLTGSDNPSWRGGYRDYYGESWPEQRRTALKRDGYSCQVCGMTREEHYEEYDMDINVHHKLPIRTFDDPDDANYQENLITLCIPHHHELENKDVVPHNDLRAPPRSTSPI